MFDVDPAEDPVEMLAGVPVVTPSCEQIDLHGEYTDEEIDAMADDLEEQYRAHDETSPTDGETDVYPTGTGDEQQIDDEDELLTVEIEVILCVDSARGHVRTFVIQDHLDRVFHSSPDARTICERLETDGYLVSSTAGWDVAPSVDTDGL
jgi:hypothetical protein